jgi:hypothetical protein
LSPTVNRQLASLLLRIANIKTSRFTSNQKY